MAPSSCHRYDFAPIVKSETTDEGFLRVWCRAARCGTQLYRRADGSQVREYRPPEEVQNPESLSTFGMKPATWGHPPVLLDSKNTSTHQIGFSGSNVRFSDGFVEVALTITDQQSIDKIKSGDAREVSAGYKVDFDPTPGTTPEGEEYAGVQRNIRVNHIAVVPRGRAGPEVKLLMDRMDASDAVAESDQPDFSALQSKPLASPYMATVKLDGLEIDLPAEIAPAIQSFSRDMERRHDAVASERDALTESVKSLTEQIETLAYEKESAEGRADALIERVEELEASTSDRLDTAAIDELVMQRMGVLHQLAPAFEEDFKFDGLGEAELYSTAFENLTGEAPREDSSPEYISGVVDGILSRFDSEEDSSEEEEKEPVAAVSDAPEAKEDRADSSVQLRDALSGAGQPQASSTDVYRQKMAAAWKAPLTASK